MDRRKFIAASLALPAIPVVALVPTAPLRDPLIDRSIDLHAAVWIRTPWHERPEQPWFDIGGETD